MVSQITPNDWIDPKRLVQETPTQVQPTVIVPSLLTLCIIGTADYAAIGITRLIWSPLIFIGIAASAASLWKLVPPVFKFIRKARTSLPLEQYHRSMLSLESAVGDTTPGSSVLPGTWLRSKADHEQTRRLARGGRPRLLDEPPATFQLCTARHQVSPSKYKASFADGTWREYNYQERVYYHRFAPASSRLLRFETVDLELSAKVLSEMIDFLLVKEFSTLGELAASEHDSAAAGFRLHAIRTAYIWGLIEGTDPNDRVPFYDALSMPTHAVEDLLRLDVRITGAGRVWANCSPDAVRAAERRKTMERDKQRSIRVNVKGGTNTNWTFGDVYDGVHSHQNLAPDAELINALTAMLQTPDVPWGSDADKALVSRAVARQDLSDRKLKPALSRALSAMGNAGLGLLESSAIELLRHFVNS
jgi:hypothetical protein